MSTLLYIFHAHHKGCMNLGPKSTIQWICREWVGKLGFNESDNKQSGSRWQENEDRLV